MEADKEELIKKFAQESNWDEVLKLYNEIFPEQITEQEEGWSACFTLKQKADWMTSVGKVDEAIKIYRTALDMAALEPDKARGALTIQCNFGYALACKNQFQEALEILYKVLEDQIALLGDTVEKSNEDVLDTRHIIAMVLERQGKLQEALALYEYVFDAFSGLYGEEVDMTAHIGFTITSLKLKIAAANAGELDLDTILKIVDYGPTIFSEKSHGDDGRDTILHRVVRTDVVQIIRVAFEELLAKCEGDSEKLKKFLNFENSEVQTPLTLAVKYECENAVKYLVENWIEHGLDVNKVTAFDNCALQLANYGTNETIKNLLLNNGAVLVKCSSSE